MTQLPFSSGLCVVKIEHLHGQQYSSAGAKAEVDFKMIDTYNYHTHNRILFHPKQSFFHKFLSYARY